MKPLTRKRFFRAFVSSVLASEMTEMELMEVLNETSYDTELSREIHRGIRVALDVLMASTPKEHFIQQHFEEPFNTAYDIIKRRKMSKNSVLEAIKVAAGNKIIKHFSEDQTMREILSTFYSIASDREQGMFNELLGYGSSKDDAFLQGIIRNR